MAYVPPHERLTRHLTENAGAGTVTLPLDLWRLIKRNLVADLVDEGWYLAAYPDVAEAVRRGETASARDHFADNGYAEGRQPCSFEVDEAWYKAQHPDIAAIVAQGEVASGHTHFNTSGWFEGRAPGPRLLAEVEAWNRVIDRPGARRSRPGEPGLDTPV